MITIIFNHRNNHLPFCFFFRKLPIGDLLFLPLARNLVTSL